MTDLRTITVPKNNSEEVRIALSEYRGQHVVDVRIFAEVGRRGDRVATQKGISLAVSKLPALIAALQAVTDDGGAA